MYYLVGRKDTNMLRKDQKKWIMWSCVFTICVYLVVLWITVFKITEDSDIQKMLIILGIVVCLIQGVALLISLKIKSTFMRSQLAERGISLKDAMHKDLSDEDWERMDKAIIEDIPLFEDGISEKYQMEKDLLTIFGILFIVIQNIKAISIQISVVVCVAGIAGVIISAALEINSNHS